MSLRVVLKEFIATHRCLILAIVLSSPLTVFGVITILFYMGIYKPAEPVYEAAIQLYEQALRPLRGFIEVPE